MFSLSSVEWSMNPGGQIRISEVLSSWQSSLRYSDNLTGCLVFRHLENHLRNMFDMGFLWWVATLYVWYCHTQLGHLPDSSDLTQMTFCYSSQSIPLKYWRSVNQEGAPQLWRWFQQCKGTWLQPWQTYWILEWPLWEALLGIRSSRPTRSDFAVTPWPQEVQPGHLEDTRECGGPAEGYYRWRPDLRGLLLLLWDLQVDIVH